MQYEGTKGGAHIVNSRRVKFLEQLTGQVMSTTKKIDKQGKEIEVTEWKDKEASGHIDKAGKWLKKKARYMSGYEREDREAAVKIMKGDDGKGTTIEKLIKNLAKEEGVKEKKGN